MILVCILKVTVLHQFSIESAIGRIANVLEEYADEFVAASLLGRGIDLQRCRNPVRKRRETLGIVAHGLAVEHVFPGHGSKPLTDEVEMDLWHVKEVAFIHLCLASAQRNDVSTTTKPSHVVDGAQG